MATSWKQADVFPLVAQVIREAYDRHRRFVTHDEITTGLLAHPDGLRMIEAAREQQDQQRSLEWLAHNMVAWFSERITVGQSEWAEEFEREHIGGKWAYVPKGTT